MEQILFSCIGTTDPVRGEHDGPMLHIVRRYRPKRIYLFYSMEMAKTQAAVSYVRKTRDWMNAHWGGYQPEWQEIFCDVSKAHDIDALDEPIHQAMAQVLRENPGCEILVNLTSGTPQMMMLMAQLAMDLRYPTRGIQVSNFEKKSGTSERANSKDYDIDLELEFNEDEQPDAPNRCTEPKLFALQKENSRRHIRALLEQRDFEAAAKLADTMPEEAGRLVHHLAARNRLQTKEALRFAGEVKTLPFPLYPYKTGSRAEYSPAAEYYLLMRNLAKAGQYTQFLLHMEPLTLKLQLTLLGKLLKSTGAEVGDFVVTDGLGRQIFDPDLLAKNCPELYRFYLDILGSRNWTAKRIEISTALCSDLLAYFQSVPAQPASLFAHYGQLKELRNRLAHSFCICTEKDITDSCGITVDVLLKEMEDTIRFCYEACDPAIFAVYDRCMDFIIGKL